MSNFAFIPGSDGSITSSYAYVTNSTSTPSLSYNVAVSPPCVILPDASNPLALSSPGCVAMDYTTGAIFARLSDGNIVCLFAQETGTSTHKPVFREEKTRHIHA